MSSKTSNDVVLNSNDGYYDISIENGDFRTDNFFDTAIIVSLETDARATENEVPNSDQRRGWIGNEFADIEMGGKVWLYSQSRRNRDNLNGLQTAVNNSLQWMIDQEITQQINSVAEFDNETGANVHISTIISGDKIDKYYPLWINTGL